jgi:hypothetical protein
MALKKQINPENHHSGWCPKLNKSYKTEIHKKEQVDSSDLDVKILEKDKKEITETLNNIFCG